MRRFGFDKFALVGHDRGSYTALRTAMDDPGVVTRVAILDGVPFLEALERCNVRFASAWWYWIFYAQPEKPERAILAGGLPEQMGAKAYTGFHAAIHDPLTVHGMLEDYRAGLSIDWQHDEMHRAQGRRITCPTLLLWSLRDDLERLYGDILGLWEPWTTTQKGRGSDCGGVSRMWGDGDVGDMTGRSVAGWGFADGVGLALGRNRDQWSGTGHRCTGYRATWWPRRDREAGADAG
jgi:haloacetate dehalogenase